jgi:hypothetical protein
MNKKINKIFIAILVALILSGIQFWTAMTLSQKILWQVNIMHWIVGPGPILGYDSTGNPLYEGTPVHMVAAYFGLFIGVIIYAVIVYRLTNRKQQQQPYPVNKKTK